MCGILGYDKVKCQRWYKNETENDPDYWMQIASVDYLTEQGLYTCLMLSKRNVGK